MGWRKLEFIALLNCGVILANGLQGIAIAAPFQVSGTQYRPDLRVPDLLSLNQSLLDQSLSNLRSSELHLAQADDLGCRQTNSTTGVYEQPNLDSSSRAILENGQTVRLSLAGTGTGWARISQPAVGWVQARYLTPAVACDGLGTSVGTETPGDGATQATAAPAAAEQRLQPAASTFPSPDPSRLRDSTQNRPFLNRPADVTASATVTCDVLPRYGLIVRSDPTVAGETYRDTIPPGTYQFQFTRNTQTNETPEGTRRWVYILAPVEGWISLGFVGKEFNLGGRACG